MRHLAPHCVLFLLCVCVPSVFAAEVLIVNSGTNTVLIGSSVDGSILNPSFITDPNLATPVNAIDSGRGTVFISDQMLDEVREYDYMGQFLRTVVDNTQVDNIRGIAVRDNGLYVTVADGVLGGSVQRFDLRTGVQSTFINVRNAAGTTLKGSPWDITFRDNDILVSDSIYDQILRYDLDGNYLNDFSSNPLGFPQQINIAANGDVVVGNFQAGINVLDSNGVFQQALLPTGARGSFRLENGNYLTGNGINLTLTTPGGQVTDVITGSGNSFRFIEPFTRSVAIPEPSTYALIGIALAVFVYRRHPKKQLLCSSAS